MDGSYNVKIRFTKGRAVKRISTDLFATGEDTDRKRNIHSTTNQERFQSINRDRGTSLYLFLFVGMLDTAISTSSIFSYPSALTSCG